MENNLLGNPGNPANPFKNLTTKIPSHNRLAIREASFDPHLSTHLDAEIMTAFYSHLARG